MVQASKYVGVILAAGVGSRLRPMTNNKPKCLVEVAGKAILQYQLDSYISAGIEEVVIVVGYEGNAVREYCKHIKSISIKVVENLDYETTNNMYSLYLAYPYIKGKCFVLNNADLVVEKEVVRDLLDLGDPDAVAVDIGSYSEESMKIKVGSDGLIKDISKVVKQSESIGCSIDFYKFSKESGKVFFDKVEDIVLKQGNRSDWTEVAMQQLFRTGELNFSVCDVSKRSWVEIDNYADLSLADRIFSGFDKHKSAFETYIFDLDGTVYLGDSIFPGVGNVISRLREENKRICFLTNNSSRSPYGYVEKLDAMGVWVNREEVISSIDLLVDFLAEKGVKKIHVLGTKALVGVLIEEGFDLNSDNPEYVVLGYDTELTYDKLIRACSFINRGIDILATHADVFCPSENGPIPDIGSLIEMIRLTTGKEPVKVFGKPSPEISKFLERRNGFARETAIIFGDRINTDIALAKNIGIKSALVLSGETTRDMLEQSQVKPDYILDSISDI